MLFLSTLPARGATVGGRVLIQPIVISIHAPREGSDRPTGRIQGGRKQFLSTLPARGATSVVLVAEAERHISIHAPREGSDAAPW